MAIDDRQVRPFADWLLDQRGGAAHDEASEALNELLEAVNLYGKAGTLTFTVKIRPAGSESSTVFISDEVKLTKPQPDRPVNIFFLDDDFNPHRNNPRQQQFEGLREVPQPRPAPADADTGEVIQ